MRILPQSIRVKMSGDYLEKKIHHNLNTLNALLHVDMLKMPHVMETYSTLRKNLGEDIAAYNGKRFYDWFNKRLKSIDNTERIFLGYDARND